MKSSTSESFCKSLGIQTPVICGAMYPCSNPELVAAASEAGGIGIVQPLSLVYVYKYDFREGLRYIRTLTKKPIGVNLLIEASSQIYIDRMMKYLDIALEEGVRFFVTALGNPSEVVRRVHTKGGLVFHDVTERKWAEKALAAGVDGFIAVNGRAGGHAGTKSPEELFSELQSLGKPVICAGGVGGAETYQKMLGLGYSGVQMGTRFIATEECHVHHSYKEAILKAEAKDIVLTERLTGVPVAVINTPFIQKSGTKASGILKLMLRSSKLKHYARMWYSIRSFMQLRRSSLKGLGHKDFWQAGKSVSEIQSVKKVADVMEELVR